MEGDVNKAEVRVLLSAGDRITALGKDRLAELDEWAYGLAKQFAPQKDGKGKAHWENPGDELRFMRFFHLAAKCALGRAAFESPRYAAVAVVSGLTTSPVERGGRPRGLSPMAMFSIAVVDRGFKRLPLCGATILPFLDLLAQPLDFGRGH
jgi:hypothetical protein